MVLEVKAVVDIILTFHMNGAWTVTVVSDLRMLKEVLIGHTEAIIHHTGLLMVACVGRFTYLLFIDIQVFL